MLFESVSKESAPVVEPTVETASFETALNEFNEAVNDVVSLEAAFNADLQQLESYVFLTNSVENIVENGSATHQNIASLESVMKMVEMEVKVSFESSDDLNTRLTKSNMVSMESMELLKKGVDAVVKAFKKLVSFIRKLFVKNTGAQRSMEKRLDDIEKRIKDETRTPGVSYMETELYGYFALEPEEISQNKLERKQLIGHIADMVRVTDEIIPVADEYSSAYITCIDSLSTVKKLSNEPETAALLQLNIINRIAELTEEDDKKSFNNVSDNWWGQIVLMAKPELKSANVTRSTRLLPGSRFYYQYSDPSILDAIAPNIWAGDQIKEPNIDKRGMVSVMGREDMLELIKICRNLLKVSLEDINERMRKKEKKTTDAVKKIEDAAEAMDNLGWVRTPDGDEKKEDEVDPRLVITSAIRAMSLMMKEPYLTVSKHTLEVLDKLCVYMEECLALYEAPAN
jgi:hypothetical protein